MDGSKEEVSVGDIRSELFEGDNIIMDMKTDRGLSNLKEAGGDKST